MTALASQPVYSSSSAAEISLPRRLASKSMTCIMLCK
jgi:hypothetical protein